MARRTHSWSNFPLGSPSSTRQAINNRLRPAILCLALAVALGCSPQKSENTAAPIPRGTGGRLPEARTTTPQPATTAAALPNPGDVRTWQFAESFEDFHGKHLQAIAYTGDPAYRSGVNPYLPDATQAQGAAWGLSYGEMTLLLPGNRVRTQQWQVHSTGEETTARGATQDESALYQRFETGGTFTLQEEQGRIILTGALRNTPECQRCHEGPEDRLLGVYVYPFQEIDDD